MEANWTIYGKRADFNAIAEKYNIDPVIARIIRNRDVVDDEDIRKYLCGTLADTYSPELMKDMKKGCEVIAKGIREGKHIRVIGDYDVDGVMSTYILYRGMKDLGADISYDIPDRMLDGYGINERLIREAAADGVDIIITCDNGISADSAQRLAAELGMPVVVTDHHEVPPDKELVACAVIDIKQAECKYPFKELCGAGVAYKFMSSLYSCLGGELSGTEFLEMVAIATVCDVMSLVDENRIYVKEGLARLEHTKNYGLRAMLEVNGLKGKKLASYHLGFVIGPCINAAGRLSSAKLGMELLMSDNYEDALKRAEALKELNDTRKSMTEQGVAAATELVEQNYREDAVILIYMPELHESLAGIVAGKIREKYYRPTFVFTKASDGNLKGSGRSIEGFNMFRALCEVKELLLKYGGHELAAGLSVEEGRLDALRDRLNREHGMSEQDLTPVVRMDAAMPFSYISEELVEQLHMLEPFGKGNEKPIFGQADVSVAKAYKFGSEGQYVRLTLMDKDGYRVEAVIFDGKAFTDAIKMWFTDEECDKMFRGLPNSIKLDIAYYPEINEYGGRRSIQIKPVQYRKS